MGDCTIHDGQARRLGSVTEGSIASIIEDSHYDTNAGTRSVPKWFTPENFGKFLHDNIPVDYKLNAPDDIV